MSILRITLAGIVFACIGISAARADKIDGVWCRDNTGSMRIDGPSITTPSGTATQGDYSRHAFSYVVPPGDPGAGATVQMRLANEDTVYLRAGSGAEPEVWHRCSPPVSRLEPGRHLAQRLALPG